MFNVGQRRKTNSNTSFSGKAEKLDRRPQIRLPNARPSFHALGLEQSVLTSDPDAASDLRVVGQACGAPFPREKSAHRRAL